MTWGRTEGVRVRRPATTSFLRDRLPVRPFVSEAVVRLRARRHQQRGEMFRLRSGFAEVAVDASPADETDAPALELAGDGRGRIGKHGSAQITFRAIALSEGRPRKVRYAALSFFLCAFRRKSCATPQTRARTALMRKPTG